jgi:predicted MFS family arabinose efflux permease
MVEKGQPRGLTGRLQSVQWTAMYAATIIAGVLGGYLSHHNRQELGFAICGLFSLVTLALAWAFVREAPAPAREGGFSAAVRELGLVVRTPAVLTAAAFIVLWNFNPFSTTVLYVYMTDDLKLGEQFYGATVSVLSVGAITASLAYGAYCRRVPLKWLIHLSILAGVLATLAYAALAGRTSAMAISFVVGFAYMTGWLVQLDLAARACPIGAAGTTFALLMALSNLSYSLSAAVGGNLFDRWTVEWGADRAFDLLVAIGALATCACWLVVPWLLRERQ